MLSPKTIAAFLLLFGPLTSCYAESPPPEIEALRWVLNANPVTDAKKAVERNDRTLLGVHGYTWTIPGVEESEKHEYRKKYGLKLIEGTGDVVLNREHLDLIKKATEYARRYNMYLLEHKSEK